ncbi:bacterioferritin [Rhodospirillum rubrum]|uniref:Bacterioferritin n=1 Tax=Rhodospirillum rubrum (strain ATCC 11170 / ATH 1.1.1 / DSM 467 / LMG 4362 / NCIMB 8255 / S1) TaxID=269796 RepID=Q2RNM7_RHORT|nr:bacterioferritin [Rhodospirillum rubrum]ABC24268.1 Bacterioferritin [Rhodospirillum rubrum ATCC 11170]AEO50019.1 bacterioferritin [Rhodospirillum rubrum F11]MBK5955987.1 bacterioferritin [Rhodospirillum rubrum]QXG80198.1 bacterioferritin [Rhodospirillum rubrum]HCF19214.1 bacterioferritin [Rhodospirillum rubrum]
MKGNAAILAELNTLLAYEMTASDQYFVHAHVYKDLGLPRLHARIKHEQEEELEHARVLIERILFLEGTPDLGQRPPTSTSRHVPEMLALDLDTERTVVTNLRRVIKLCEAEKDYVTRQALLPLLNDTEEDHLYWLEQQLRLIELTGLQNYLQAQMDPAVAA